jgi:hypothetical protein
MPKLQLPDVGKVQGDTNYARTTADTSGGRALEKLGDSLQNTSRILKDINDSIESNELLAEHTIAARGIQSSLEREGYQSDEMVPEYEKRLKSLNEEVFKKAKSSDVRARLQQILPMRGAAYTSEVQQHADQRFKSEALAGYERMLQKNTTAYALAKSDQERELLKNQHLGTLDVLSSRYVITPEQREKEGQRFSRSVELFDVQRNILADPSAGLDALLNPTHFLEKYPNVKIEDLDNIYGSSLQAQELQTRQLEKARKEARESIISRVDEETIRGGMTFDKLNQLRDSNLISPDDYRRNALAIQKITEEGGPGDPYTQGLLATRIRLNPKSVSTSEITSGLNNGSLSRKGVNELLDLKHTWERNAAADARAEKLANKPDAPTTPTRLKGPLYSVGKNKIDRIIGKGMGGMLGMLDPESQRIYGNAIDLYQERAMKEPNKPHAQISDEIIEMFKGPVDVKEVVPGKYKNEKGNPAWDKIKQDYLKADPSTKKFMDGLVGKLKEIESATEDGEY